MAKVTLGTVANLLGNPNSAANTINSNSALITSAFENTLSRDGTTPNQMLSDLDMNNNDILNIKSIDVEELFIDGSLVGTTDVPLLILDEILEARDSAQAWAEGTLPGGPGTKSSKEWAEDAANSAELAKNNWVLAVSEIGTSTPKLDFPLLVDPGSKNNIFLTISGIHQNVEAYDLVYISTVPTLRLTEPLPEFTRIEARIGNALVVNTPSDSSVTTTKIADGNVTTAKLSDSSVVTTKIADGAVTNSKLASDSVTTIKVADNSITLAKQADIASQRLIGRVTVGTGDPEVLTPAQLRDTFFPVGSVVDSVYARYTTKVALSAVIPADATIPQNNEGTEILSASITPKAIGNKFRIRFRGWGSVDTAPNNLAYAIFVNGNSNALDAGLTTFGTAGYTAFINGEAEFTSTSLSALTFSVRVGPTVGPNAYLNGNNVNTHFSTAGGSTLVVEEIKG